jgi:pilus assembly protein CpaB
MDRKKLVLLIGALVIAIGTALAARSMFAGASAPQAVAAPAEPQGPKVLVAKRALPVGTIITADAIGYQLWPQEMVQDAYFIDGEADMSKLLGTVVRNPITAGEPVTQGSLVSPGDRGFLAAALGPGMRAVTVPVSEKTAAGGFIFPGDRVDILLTSELESEEGDSLKTAETVLQNLRVLATDQSTETTTSEDGKTVVRAFRTVTLEATPKVAEKIAVAQTIGTLSLSLRSIADNQSELERAIASGAVNVPEGLSPAEEAKMLKRAMARPQPGPATFVTGGEVSRFARSTVPRKNNSIVATPDGVYAVGNGAPGAAKPAGPTVRVHRGTATTEDPVAKAAGALFTEMMKNQGGAAAPVGNSVKNGAVAK